MELRSGWTVDPVGLVGELGWSSGGGEVSRSESASTASNTTEHTEYGKHSLKNESMFMEDRPPCKALIYKPVVFHFDVSLPRRVLITDYRLIGILCFNKGPDLRAELSQLTHPQPHPASQLAASTSKPPSCAGRSNTAKSSSRAPPSDRRTTKLAGIRTTKLCY